MYITHFFIIGDTKLKILSKNFYTDWYTLNEEQLKINYIIDTILNIPRNSCNGDFQKY